MPTPTAVLPTNTTKKAHAACNTPPGVNPPPDSSAYIARYSTTATASFMTDSPKTTANKSGSTRKSEKMARTVTGSVAPTTVPNIMASTNENGCERPTAPRIHMPSPKASAPTAVPTKAKYAILPMFLKNGSASMR